MGENTTSIISSATAPVSEHMTHWRNVQWKPSQKIGAKNINTITAKIRLSLNCPIKVDT